MPTDFYEKKEIVAIAIRMVKEERRMRKTILVEYKGGFSKDKKYAFNVEGSLGQVAAVKVGTVFNTKAYTNNFEVVAVLDETYEYVNKSNGDLKKSLSNTNDMKIKTIDLDKLSQVVSFVEA